MKKFIILLATVALLIMVVSGMAQQAKATKFKYVGVKKCKMCHKGVKKGKIYEKWQAAAHSKAYTKLASDHAKEVAKKAGVKGDPQQAKECLVCHVTAYDVAANLKAATLTMAEGVSCESCHGPGSAYKSLKVMKAIAKGTMKGADYGLVKPTKEVCVKCHNPKSPTYKEFKFEVAVKKITHKMAKK